MNNMKIVGVLDTYDCEWRTCGYSFAEVVVKVEKVIPAIKILGVTIVKESKAYKEVWVSRGKGFPRHCMMRLATPERINTWYKEVVKEYEDHCLAWANNPYKD
jgi:hypothetical protein